MPGATLPVLGLFEALGAGEESTYGTGVSMTEWYRLVKWSGGRVDTVEADAGPSGGGVQLAFERSFKPTPKYAMSASVLLEYTDVGRFLKQFLGVDTATIIGGGPYYTHTFALNRVEPTVMNPSLTITRLNNAGKTVYNGCVLKSLTISGGPNRIATVDFDFTAQSGGTSYVGGSVGTFSTAPFAEFVDMKLLWHDTPATVSPTAQVGAASTGEWSVKFTVDLAERELSGSRFNREPVWNGYRNAEISVAREFADQNMITSIMQLTTALAYDTVSVSLASAVGSYALSMYSPYATLITRTQDHGGAMGVEPENLTWRAGMQLAGGATEHPMTLTLINQRTTAY